MSNHYHVVLHVDKKRAEAWSDKEVVERWLQLYKGNLLLERWMKRPGSVDKAQMAKVQESIAEWRMRLYDIGWFMRGVNETVARMANEEEGCKGRFWEGRFKRQALLDEAALLSCMAYVDLNPVRADMAEDLFKSDFTSVQERLYDYVKHKTNKSKDERALSSQAARQKELKKDLNLHKKPESKLLPFDGSYSYCVGSRGNVIDFSSPFKRNWAKGAGKSILVYAST